MAGSLRKGLARRGTRVVAVALAIALTGCASDGPGEDPTDPGTSASADASGPTQAVEPEPSETADPDVAIPEGSGCDPGPGDLPDGLWFGSVERLTTDELDLDLACWFIGEDAVIAAEEDGQESPPPNDYYVRDNSTRVRTVPIDADASAVIHPTGSPNDQETGTVADLIAVAEARDGYPWGVWIEVEGGVVVDLQEQWVP